MKKYSLIIILVIVIALGFLTVKLFSKDNKVQTVVQTNGTYIALGDSVAAGIGLGDYTDSSACDRTIHAYPNAVATALNYKLQSVACSGATTQNGLIGTQVVNKLAIEPQLNSLLSGTKPNLISMTIGANDANWTSFIQKCYTGNCGSDADTNAVNAGVAAATTNLINVFSQIQSTYPTETPRVVITGYYKLFPASPKANCTELVGIDQQELKWITTLQNTIDESLKSAASAYDFVTYVPIDFSGHELCTASPWIQGLSDKAPYHPTLDGQAAIANQIVTALKTNGAIK
ncbi:MAG: SGNH/GDSL hydrolase family protein [Candidatus Saccharimonadales bacterium]